jgi:hypothetical protein
MRLIHPTAGFYERSGFTGLVPDSLRLGMLIMIKDI